MKPARMTLLDRIQARYRTDAVRTRVPMQHSPLPPAPVGPKVNIAFSRPVSQYIFNLQARHMRLNANRTTVTPRPAITLETLFSDRRAPEYLVSSLWKAYQSHHTSLRNQFTALIVHAGRTEITSRAPGANLVYYRRAESEPPAVLTAAAVERIVTEKLKSESPPPKQQPVLNEEKLYREITRRINQAQHDELRFEKIKRGLL